MLQRWEWEGEIRWISSISKFAAEHLTHNYHEEFGLLATSIRRFNIYVPCQVGKEGVHKFIKRATSSEIAFVPKNYVDVELRIPNIKKSKDILKFIQKVNLKDDLKRIIDWYIKILKLNNCCCRRFSINLYTYHMLRNYI